MFKKFIAFMMVVAIFTVQAQAASQNGLKAAFDEMNYALTVEWDQKDQSFYEAQIKNFISVVRGFQKAGMTNSQMIDFAKSEIKDAKVAKDLETAFSMITINKMSSEEASEYMISSMKRAYSNGASWNGDVVIIFAVAIAIIAVAAVLSSSSNPTMTGPICYEECVRYDWFAPHEGSDYICTTYCE